MFFEMSNVLISVGMHQLISFFDDDEDEEDKEVDGEEEGLQ